MKIDEAISLIINIYDRILHYQEQSKLAIYLSDLQSAGIQNLNITDTQLRNNFNQLQFNLRANFILAQYNRAVDGLKQTVFPFAADYFDMYQLPATFAADEDLSAAAITAANKVKSLSERIQKLNETERIHIAYYGRDVAGSRPLYVWRNAEVNDRVRELFSGKKFIFWRI